MMRLHRKNADIVEDEKMDEAADSAIEELDDDSEKSAFTNRTEEWVDKLQTGPMIKYLGLSFLLTYHYVTWFVPDSFFNVRLLDASVTFGWLINLATVSVTMIIAAAFLGRKRHLSDSYPLISLSVVILVASTFCMQYLPGITGNIAFLWPFAALNGVAEGALLIVWGEALTRMKAHFSTVHIGFTFGMALIICVTLATIAPDVISPCIAILLVTASGIMLIHVSRNSTESYPQPLPKKAIKPAEQNVAIICVIMFFTSAACYYLIAIIPLDTLSFGDDCFSFGSIFAGVLFAILSLTCHLMRDKKLIFKLFPHLLVFAVVAFVIFLVGYDNEPLKLISTTSFTISLTVSTMLEVSMIMYFGILVRRGFFAPAGSLAIAVGSTRLGILAGNSLALFYESQVAAGGEPPIYMTSLLCIVLLAFMLVPMSKREFHIIKMTSTPAAPSEIDVICEQIIEEFKLSGREGEILILISQGNTANSIATKLVISPHTVNTHIRHIYEKVGIHKRSELLEYINMRKGD